MTEKIALLFPGQGSQYVGMGFDFCKQFDFARDIFEQINGLTKKNISQLCFKGPDKELKKTNNLQPAILGVSLCCLKALEQEGIESHYVAGHSLGEYCALFSSGVLSLQDTIKLVNLRGELMNREAIKNKSMMCALIGLPLESVSPIVAKIRKQGRVINIANYNTKDQLVISGQDDAVSTAANIAKTEGAKRVVKLNVSGAYHCNLMEDARIDFKKYLDHIQFNKPKRHIVMNVTGDFESHPPKIKENIIKQFTSTVLWYKSIQRLISQGVSMFIEVGPGRILRGLLRQINSDYNSYSAHCVENVQSVNHLLKALKG